MDKDKKRKASERGRAAYEARLRKTKGLTKAEIKNGWTSFEMQKYIKDLDESANRKLGLGGREPADLPHSGSNHYDPLDW